MSRVLLLGESWFVHSVHQKGFDSFSTSEYTEGGAEFVEALSAGGHQVTRVPAHRITSTLPTTPQGLHEVADVIVISDVGANTFLLSPQSFNHSRIEPDRIAAVREFVRTGGGLLMVGGYMTFSGIDAKARWGRSALAEALPVDVLDRDDRVELPSGGAAVVVDSAHEVTKGLDSVWPELLGLNEVVAKATATTLVTCESYPLLVVGNYGEGRTAAFTSDLAPHWAPPRFLAWEGYSTLFTRLVTWLNAAA